MDISRDFKDFKWTDANAVEAERIIGRFRRSPHLRSLARVAVAAATEHAPQLATPIFGDLMQGSNRLIQRIRCVRIIDHDHRRFAPA